MHGRLKCRLGLHRMDIHNRSDWSQYRQSARCGKQVEGREDGPLCGPADGTGVKPWDPMQFR